MISFHQLKNTMSACLLSAGVCAGAMLGACAADDLRAGLPASGGGRLLASLDLPNQRSLRFHEPEEGTVITSEVGSIANAGPIDPGEEGLDPVQLYEYLAHRPAPAALVDALARTQSSDGRRVDDAPESIVQEPVHGKADKETRSPGIAGDRGWFDGALCKATDRNYLWTDVTGDGLVRTKGTNYFKTGAYAVTGTITYRVSRWDCGLRQCDLSGHPDPNISSEPSFDEEGRVIENNNTSSSGPFIYTLTRGTYAWARIDCKNCTVEATVTEAAGVTYDFCTNYHY